MRLATRNQAILLVLCLLAAGARAAAAGPAPAKIRRSIARAGDVVAWRLPNGLHHIGVVAEDRVPGTSRPYVVHNIGYGAQQEDVLLAFVILGHYRW